ncbi:MAG: acyl-CoA/acyl-ACP dehydrogenase [Paracoccaceae bacterium]|nr:acyl-CoA/acyl-ACP dehydrogenase [Paracoccaceae bacterium]MDE2911726.1 acyl-CoA/acyl-ACP dehydrogenase [Paracoccaceae bacterium]
MTIQPIFDPDAWNLTTKQAELNTRVRQVASEKFAARAAGYDRDATFPTENYRDLADAGLLGICIPESEGGIGADLKTYMLAASELGRFCGATALTFNMHVSSCLWTGDLLDGLEMDDATRRRHHAMRRFHYRRILDDGAVYAQPFSEGNAAAAGFKAFGTTALRVDGGWRVNGRKIFASLAGHADYYGTLCTALRKPGDRHLRRNTMYIAVPADADGVRVEGTWDTMGMRATVSRNLVFDDVFVPESEQLMPEGVYAAAASRWPHMFMTLTPTYMGIAQACYDFTVAYLRGEIPGVPVKRRMYPTKQIAVAEMHVKLEQTKAIWFQAISEARPDPDKPRLMRAWAAQHTVMENANTLAQTAIRTCGGQSIMCALPLERLYRDSRCGSLMLPWTAELCLDMLGKAALYESGETDDP